MSEIPTLSQYDGKRAKVRCSLQWVIVEAYGNDELPKQLAASDVACVFESDGGLKRNITMLLCTADPYCRIARDVFSINDPLRSHEDVIQILCRKGMYVLDDNDIITAHDLRRMPLDLTSHLAVIDMLMLSTVSYKTAPINGVVATVKRFSSFSASKELPVNLEEAIVLWLNKISMKVRDIRRTQLESDKHTFGQAPEDEFEFPVIENISEDLCDGRSLALLLHYYCPDRFSLQEICLKDPCSIADSWHNLHLSLGFCNRVILPPVSSSFHDVASPGILHPVDLLYCGPDLRPSLIAFLGSLHYYLEMEALEGIVRPLGHVVECKRRMTNTMDSVDSMGSTSARQATKPRVDEFLPGVQPLISSATKRSFVNVSSSDTESTMSSSTLGTGNPLIPFSSKPLLVRRNREVHTTQPSSTAKLGTQALSEMDRLPALESSNHGSGNGQAYGLDAVPEPVVNKWQVRTPVQDAGSALTSNNVVGVLAAANATYGVSPHLPRKLPRVPKVDRHQIYDGTLSQSSHASTLLSHVAVESDGENEDILYLGHSNGYASHPASVNLNWTGFQHVDQAPVTPASDRMTNDLHLETARTSDDQSSQSPRSVTDSCAMSTSLRFDTCSAGSASTTDLTSVSSRTNGSLFGSQFSSSGETTTSASSDVIRGPHYPTLQGHYPEIVTDENSPEKSSTLATPSTMDASSLHSYNSAVNTKSNIPHSQKSYTVQSGTFRTANSARDAGYPIIEDSPDRPSHHPTPSHSDMNGTLKSSTTDRKALKSRMSSFAENGSGDSTVLNGVMTTTQNQMVVGNTVVKLRNPNRRKDRNDRAVKTTSWVEIAQRQQVCEAQNEDKRRHSHLVPRQKLVELRRKVAERRNEIEQEKRRRERMNEREWAKELLKVRKDMYSFALGRDKMVPNGNAAAHTDPRVRNPVVPVHFLNHIKQQKNEETSSDYSSKSPSPSGVDSIEQADGRTSTHETNSKDKHFQTPLSSETQDYFASPLSSTVYVANTTGRSNLNQSYEQAKVIADGTAGQTYMVTDQMTHDVTERETYIRTPNNKTYNHSQVCQLPPQEIPPHSVQVPKTIGNNSKTFDVSEQSSSLERTVVSVAKPPMPRVPQTCVGQDVEDKVLQTLQGVRRSLPQDSDSSPTRRILDQQDAVSSRGRAWDVGPSPRPAPQINIVQSSPQATETTTTRRSLFKVPKEQETLEQENIDSNNITIADQPSQLGTYDSFCRMPSGSNHSTPAKSSPLSNVAEETPTKGDAEDMSSILLRTADKDRKGGKGFELVDESSPGVDMAKKKEQFLLKRLKKEEELKKKKAERENDAEKRKGEARVKQEEAAAKKEEERLKRQQRLEEYKKRKQQDEEAHHSQQSSGIISGGSGKKQPPGKDTSQHSSRSTKTARSGRSSPASVVSRAGTNVSNSKESPRGPTNVEAHTTFHVNSSCDKGDGSQISKFSIAKSSSGGRKDWETDSAVSSAVSSEYSGPKLYKQPSSKSNRNLIYNAISHCCLPAKVNEALRNKTIEVLEMSDARHLMVLFRDSKCQFRALYNYDPETEKLHKLTGNGPANIIPSMIEKLFKYNSGRKAFIPLPSKTLSVSIDAITIKNTLWQSTKKPPHPGANKK